MSDIVVCAPLRTVVGRFGGSLRDVPVQELGAIVVKALVDRTNLDPNVISDVVLGNCYPSSEAPALGRVVALDAGLPVTVPACRSTGAAAPAFRRCFTRPLWYRWAPPTW
jgi:acetyl-CoA C-acetyltransferase